MTTPPPVLRRSSPQKLRVLRLQLRHLRLQGRHLHPEVEFAVLSCHEQLSQLPRGKALAISAQGPISPVELRFVFGHAATKRWASAMRPLGCLFCLSPAKWAENQGQGKVK